VQSLANLLDFPAEVKNAVLAALLLLIPLCANLLATYLRTQLLCLSHKLEANTNLTQRTLSALNTTNALLKDTQEQLEDCRALVEAQRDRRRATDPARPAPEVS
jgi:hypothetical protein